MNRIRQSFSWWCVAGKCGNEAAFLREMKKVGYEGVELIPQNLWDTAKEAGLAIASEGAHKSLTDGLNRRENHNRIEDEINAKLELAVKYQIPNLICFSGNRAGLTDEQGAINTADGLARVAQAAEKCGVNLVLELLNSKVNHIDYQCDHTAWGMMVVRMVNSPRVKLLYDIYHMQVMEGDVIRTLRDNIAGIGHVHTAGNPGRNDLDDTQELYYPAIMRALAATDYRGFVGQEFSPKADPVAAFRHAFNVCNV